MRSRLAGCASVTAIESWLNAVNFAAWARSNLRAPNFFRIWKHFLRALFVTDFVVARLFKCGHSHADFDWADVRKWRIWLGEAERAAITSGRKRQSK
jgi:hypothetical protein